MLSRKEIMIDITLKYKTHPIGRLMRDRILNLLINKEMSVSSISKKINLTWPSTDYHIKFLESIGKIKIKYKKGQGKGRMCDLKVVSLV